MTPLKFKRQGGKGGLEIVIFKILILPPFFSLWNYTFFCRILVFGPHEHCEEYAMEPKLKGCQLFFNILNILTPFLFYDDSASIRHIFFSFKIKVRFIVFYHIWRTLPAVNGINEHAKQKCDQTTATIFFVFISTKVFMACVEKTHIVNKHA